jgi:S1-C subfamily serine protease
VLRIIRSLLVVACCCLGSVANSNSDAPFASVGELEKLNFVADKDGHEALTPYSEVLEVKRTFLAYDAVAKSISKYRDPERTRGAQGEFIFRTVSPAVVAVVVGRLDQENRFNPEGLGTGAIVDSGGYVLTNWHVISGYGGALVFLKPSGSPDLTNALAVGAKVVYQDSTTDLALLKMVNPPNNLPALTIGSIGQVQIAEDIHIIGHPHGNFWSYSTGVVSQIRDAYTWKYEDGSQHASKVLQLQTAINPGNSGGPVVDDSGRVLGLVAMSEEGQNLDYAIAADVIARFLGVGMHMNTRGPKRTQEAPPRPQKLLVATATDQTIVKAVYPDLTLYVVQKRDKTTVGVVAKFSNGGIITGSQPDIDGTFRHWSGDFPGGIHLAGSASGGVLSSVSRSPSTSLPR